MAGEHSPRAEPVCSCGLFALAHRPSHNPKQWPICLCGAYAKNHRVKHQFKGTGPDCETCCLPKVNHLALSPCDSSSYRIDYVGIDGEGIGRKPHRYVLLCAATIDGRRWMLEDPQGLPSVRILNWLLTTLDNCRVFSYGFGYDLTMILKDLPDDKLYKLLRPGLRHERGRIRPINWQGFTIDWLQGKLTISRKRQRQRLVIWDLVKFYQQTFVASLKDWGIPTEGIEKMKAKRSGFTLRDMPKVRHYCVTECRQLATLAKKLLDAHRDAGLTLRSYYGPGSTASVMLGIMKVKEYQAEPPEEMRDPIARAFSGGWFEHSAMGLVKPCVAADISSAYPYHAYFLPCLLHGTWEHVKHDVDRAIQNCTTALVHYSYRGKRSDIWAPFFHRDAKGGICHPYTNEGWAWLPEYRAGKRFGRVRAHSAWVYRTECGCRPFEQFAVYYRTRVELGKDAAGKPIKLGVNSGYGKLVQSKGKNPPYQNWLWGGLITSGTRAQVLDVIPIQDPSAVVAIATDGVFSRYPLDLPKPRDTGTSDLAKPLGGWEEKRYPEGILFLKPGIYLPMKGPAHMFEGNDETCEKCGLPDTDHTAAKARGIGRKKLTEQRDRIVKAYQRGAKSWTVHVDRFYGAKSSISTRRRSPKYGQWGVMPIEVAFKCPNREPDMTLLKRDGMSYPYNPAQVTHEALVARIQRDITYEQP